MHLQDVLFKLTPLYPEQDETLTPFTVHQRLVVLTIKCLEVVAKMQTSSSAEVIGFVISTFKTTMMAVQAYDRLIGVSDPKEQWRVV